MKYPSTLFTIFAALLVAAAAFLPQAEALGPDRRNSLGFRNRNADAPQIRHRASGDNERDAALKKQLSYLHARINEATKLGSFFVTDAALGKRFHQYFKDHKIMRNLAVSLGALGLEETVAHTLALHFYKFYLPRAQWAEAEQILHDLTAMDTADRVTEYVSKLTAAVSTAVIGMPIMDFLIAKLRSKDAELNYISRMLAAYLINRAVLGSVEYYLTGKGGIVHKRLQDWRESKSRPSGANSGNTVPVNRIIGANGNNIKNRNSVSNGANVSSHGAISRNRIDREAIAQAAEYRRRNFGSIE